MKKLTKVPVKREVVKEIVTEEVDKIVDEAGGLVTLLGKNVCVMCMNYIYFGRLIGVNDTCVVLENSGIVYETGEWTKNSKWKDYQKLPTDQLFIQMVSIESFFETNKG